MNEGVRLFAGVDLGTSGVRGVCVDHQLKTIAKASVSFDTTNDERRNPQLWWNSIQRVVSNLVAQVDASRIASLAIDGTSGTLLAVDSSGIPLSHALLYNDLCTDSRVLEKIAALAPATSAAHGATSALARAITLSGQHNQANIIHEADWINFKLTGLLAISDENNALKTGYDSVMREWPAWIEATGMQISRLPQVVPAGQPLGCIHPDSAAETGLHPATLIVAGTTDGCASFLATGARTAGDGVTVLGTTLTIKLLSDKPVYAPRYGIYSHRIGNRWLAGGASNTGGAVLAAHFSPEDINRLSAAIDLSVPSMLDYYPLTSPGERFPINDSTLQPRMSPRPDDDVAYLYGMLQGISNIETLAYHRLKELGAPSLATLRTVGGGADNNTWTRLRQKMLKVPFAQSVSDQAAVGTASLARDGFMQNMAAVGT